MKKVCSLQPIVLVLLLAFLLRVFQLTSIPPGLTHDEANHGREAIGILGGNLALFFPLNYGSEPLYSYTVAGLMALLGSDLLALRLVNVFFGLLAIAATYLWGKFAFNRAVGLLAAALMALTFWPIASSREALRAGMMPFLTTGAVLFFWQILRRAKEPAFSTSRRNRWLLVLGFGLCLTATLYNYLAARVVWLMFPLFLGYLALTQRKLLHRSWLPVLGGLLLSGLLVIPMFVYLQRHPQAQTRLQMFGGTVQKVLAGEVAPLLENAGSALLAFTWPGSGDQFLAYNIPGRPVFDAITSIFFVLGIAVCLWRWRRLPYAFLLIWFFVGIIPSLITGPTANTTRNVGAMPATFLLPAVGFVVLLQRTLWRATPRPRTRPAVFVAVILWLLFVGWTSAFDYFLQWGQSPDVRAAYQHTLVAQLEMLKRTPMREPVVISSVHPGPAHNPSIGLVLVGNEHELRWVDARQALILPAAEARLLVPEATPLHPAFMSWVEPLETVEMRPTDLNSSFTLFRLQQPDALPLSANPVSLGRDKPAVTLLGSRWLSDSTRAGDIAELMLVWRVEDPGEVGPILTGIDATDVVLFTHVLDASGQIVTQQDSLNAPSWDWQKGDLVVQIHQLWVPPETTPGEYNTVVGVYDRLTQERLAVLGDQRQGETHIAVDPLHVFP